MPGCLIPGLEVDAARAKCHRSQASSPDERVTVSDGGERHLAGLKSMHAALLVVLQQSSDATVRPCMKLSASQVEQADYPLKTVGTGASELRPVLLKNWRCARLSWFFAWVVF